MLNKRKTLGFLVIFLVFGGVCFTVGTVYSNGGNPTIDPSPGKGVWNFDWLNASVGVNAPYYYQNGVLFNGSGGIGGVVGGVPTYDYIIYQNESMVDLYNGHTFELEDSHAETWVVAEWAIDNLSSTGGAIHFVGDFDLGEYSNLDSCDSGWVSDDVDVTVNLDSGDKKEGTASTEIIVASGFTTGLMAHKPLPSPVDLSDFDMLGFWAKSTADFGSNKLSIAFDNDADCSSPHTYLEYFHTENLGTVWKYISAPSQTHLWGVPLDLSGASVVNSIGIYGDADPGIVTINIDDFDAQRGVIKITNGKPYQISGRAMHVDSINLNAHCNMPIFYVTAPYFTLTKIKLNGRIGSQEAIDACPGTYFRTGGHTRIQNVAVEKTKGTGFKHRELSFAEVYDNEGYWLENPFASFSGCSDVKVLRNVADYFSNDDGIWATSGGHNFEIGENDFRNGSSGLIRFSGTISLPFYNVRIHDNNLEYATLQFIQLSYVYGFSINDNSGNYSEAVGYRLENCRLGDIIKNDLGFTKQHGMYLIESSDLTVSQNDFESINFDDLGSYDGIRHSSHKVTFTENTFVDYSHGGGNFSMHRCIKEEGTPEGCEYQFNKFLAHLYSPAITIVASDSRVFRNIGYVTENADIATLVSGQTSIAVSHGCDYTPSAGDISVTAIEALGSASYWYVDTITSTQFTIHVDVNPGQDVDFAWNVNRH